MSQKMDRIRYCVLICESLYSDFDNTSPFVELGNLGAIDYTISWLIENDIQEVFLFYSHSKQEIEEYQQSFSSQHEKNKIKLRLNYMKPTELKSFGDVIREVHFRDLLSEDFLVLYADNVTNINLSEMVANHFTKKIQLKNVELTIGMRKGLSSNIYILNSTTNEILQLQTQSNKQFSLNTEKINLKKVNIDFRRDIVPIDIFICTIEVVKSFKETYEYQTMQDFIIGMLTSEVYQEKINVYQIKKNEISFRLNKASNIYLAYMNFICGYLNPYTIYADERFAKFQRNNNDKLYTVAKYNKIIRKNTKISDSVSLSNNIYIGQSTKIENNCTISKSVIGKNCIIGKNVTLKNCIILDGCTLAENSNFDYCLIEKVNETIKIHNFKLDLFEQYTMLIDRDLFQETPPAEQATFQQQLQHLLKQKAEDQTIIVSQLTRIRRQFDKSEREFTREFIKIIKPQGVKGIQSFTKVWGSILNKVHHEDQQDLINSLYFGCTSIEEYLKAFHLVLQYFYHYDILTKQAIIEWYHDFNSEAITFNLCKAFIEKLEAQSQEEDEDEDEGEENEE